MSDFKDALYRAMMAHLKCRGFEFKTDPNREGFYNFEPEFAEGDSIQPPPRRVYYDDHGKPFTVDINIDTFEKSRYPDGASRRRQGRHIRFLKIFDVQEAVIL